MTTFDKAIRFFMFQGNKLLILNNLNVIIGICHSFNGKEGTFQESLVLVMQAFVYLVPTSSGFLWKLL